MLFFFLQIVWNPHFHLLNHTCHLVHNTLAAAMILAPCLLLFATLFTNLVSVLLYKTFYTAMIGLHSPHTFTRDHGLTTYQNRTF